MVQRRTSLTPEERERALADLRRDVATRNAGYRANALKLLSHICGSCAREFSGKRLKELTVHHKDHNHNNNPPDGSNWELLCLYCHDHEHEKSLDAKYCQASSSGAELPEQGLASPFEQLESLMEPGGN